MTLEVCALIEEKIQLDFSPEQVSDWLPTEKDIKISHERIYQHVWADKRESGELYKHLRHSNKNEKSSTDQKISVARLEIESVLMSDQRLSDKERESGIGK